MLPNFTARPFCPKTAAAEATPRNASKLFLSCLRILQNNASAPLASPIANKISASFFQASISISDIRRILTPFQFYVFEENLSDAERIRRKLQGSCSLGPQYTTKASCEAAGGVWTDGTTGLSTDGNGDYDGNSENDNLLDAAGNPLDPNRLC